MIITHSYLESSFLAEKQMCFLMYQKGAPNPFLLEYVTKLFCLLIYLFPIRCWLCYVGSFIAASGLLSDGGMQAQ